MILCKASNQQKSEMKLQTGRQNRQERQFIPLITSSMKEEEGFMDGIMDHSYCPWHM